MTTDSVSTNISEGGSLGAALADAKPVEDIVGIDAEARTGFALVTKGKPGKAAMGGCGCGGCGCGGKDAAKEGN
ncbi:MAG: hypothetical protein Q4G30_05420 [Actinomycetaceae bacterium]|nr:hypothetical protein [Actinomycetaceae bacterium]